MPVQALPSHLPQTQNYAMLRRRNLSEPRKDKKREHHRAYANDVYVFYDGACVSCGWDSFCVCEAYGVCGGIHSHSATDGRRIWGRKTVL